MAKTEVKMKVNQTEKIENLVANPEGHCCCFVLCGRRFER